MSSLEIAELTGKKHFHVLADIRTMLGQLATEKEMNCNLDSLKTSFKTTTYTDKRNRKKTLIELDSELTLTLVSGYNVVLRNSIIRRWKSLEESIRVTEYRASAQTLANLSGADMVKMDSWSKGDPLPEKVVQITQE